ncbi:four-helix bundle copper-binding protein [Radiobacillus sp. PE A8.2]|uniref:four-helix bundle copper-binding protein n=1 Tax=Radiobacillus sp. PE A8.2 TaxID=3380349 RepID=UPI00388D067C
MHYQTVFFQTPYEGKPIHSSDLLNTIHHCAISCNHMTTMLYKKQDLFGRGEQLSNLQDCAEICGLMVNYLALSSKFSKVFSSVCASVCEVCGSTCMQFPDQASQQCGQTCLICAKACQQLTA